MRMVTGTQSVSALFLHRLGDRASQGTIRNDRPAPHFFLPTGTKIPLGFNQPRLPRKGCGLPIDFVGRNSPAKLSILANEAKSPRRHRVNADSLANSACRRCSLSQLRSSKLATDHRPRTEWQEWPAARRSAPFVMGLRFVSALRKRSAARSPYEQGRNSRNSCGLTEI
jgi:hypothetical protein